MWLEFYFLEDILLESFMFFVSGIVDKINEIINKTVMLTRLQKVMLESSNSPNETVINRFNFNN